MTSSIGVCCEAEGNGERKEMGMYVAIQIWSPKTAKAISNNISILNGGLSPGRYCKYLPPNMLQIYYTLFSMNKL